MAGKFQIIARYTEGQPRFWIGRKVDPNRPLDDDNVEWKQKDGHPMWFIEYADAEKEVAK